MWTTIINVKNKVRPIWSWDPRMGRINLDHEWRSLWTTFRGIRDFVKHHFILHIWLGLSNNASAGYGLTFSFYLFYALCENFMVIGAVIQKIRGVWNWQVSNFHTFLIKSKLAISSLWIMQLTPKFHTSKVLMRESHPESLEKIWRHDVTWCHLTLFGHLSDLPPVKSGAP